MARAKSWQMTKANRDKFQERLYDLMESLGGRPRREYAGGRTVWDLDTPAGPLEVRSVDNYGAITAQFKDPKRAAKCMNYGAIKNVNPYSGKWNHHYGNVKADVAFQDFSSRMKVMYNRCKVK